eukprot:407670-Pelagomonas_calceolata.AAC.4
MQHVRSQNAMVDVCNICATGIVPWWINATYVQPNGAMVDECNKGATGMPWWMNAMVDECQPASQQAGLVRPLLAC